MGLMMAEGNHEGSHEAGDSEGAYKCYRGCRMEELVKRSPKEREGTLRMELSRNMVPDEEPLAATGSK